MPESLVVLETTGGYESALTTHLITQEISVHKASGLQIKNFIRLFGKFAKTDKIDALAIARYGHDRQQGLRLHEKKSEEAGKLYHLVMCKEDLTQMLVAEKIATKHQIIHWYRQVLGVLLILSRLRKTILRN